MRAALFWAGRPKSRYTMARSVQVAIEHLNQCMIEIEIAYAPVLAFAFDNIENQAL